MRVRPVSLPLLAFALALAAAALFATGCAKKSKPVTTADLGVSSEATPARTGGESPSPAAPPSSSPDFDPWSGDLDAINAYALEQGLWGDVYFDFDSVTLSEPARERLAANARFLREHPQLSATVRGQCDERGTSEYNLALGERRARTASRYLASLGIEESRLTPVSLGEEEPVCTDADEGCWSRNRRANHLISGRSDR